jgi:glycosyltransferase involved in cell wall biosynthesis
MNKIKKPNVLFISSWYPNKFEPTNGNFIERHAQAAAMYANVSALHVLAHPSVKKTTIDAQTINGIFTVYVYYPKKKSVPIIGRFVSLVKKIKAYKIGYKHLLNYTSKPDIIHSNITYPNSIFAWYMKITNGIPYLISEHWTIYLPINKNKLSYSIRFISKIIAKKANYITPVSEDLKNAMQQLGFKTKYKVVPNVVDTQLFKPLIQNHPKKQILHVSTLKDEHKNISGILETIKELRLERTDFTLKIVGDGDIKPHQKYAEQLGLDNETVSFEGEKTIEEIALLMQHSDIFLLFSNYENLPCVIIEAISCGLPVISSDVGGIKEMLDKETGILVPPKNKKALKKALHNMLDNLHLYNKHKMHQKAINKYSKDVIGSTFLTIYTEILNEIKT